LASAVSTNAPISSPFDKDIQGSVLHLVLKSLGCGSSVDSYDRRKLLQKLIYIVQKSGVDLGYGYRWYLAGPYSSELAGAYFRIEGRTKEYEQASAKLKLNPEVLAKLNRISQALGSEMNDVDLLEAMASALYLGTRNIGYLRTLKPNIPASKWKRAFDKIDSLKLLPD